MNVTKLLIAAGFAVATSAAFAETGVGTVQIDNVTNVYGRAGVSAIKVSGQVLSQPADSMVAGADTQKGDTKLAVTSGKEVVVFGRS